LQTKWQGPYQIVKRTGDEFTIENLLNGKHYQTHISNIKSFNYDPDNTNPNEVAQHDAQEFVIEKILEHNGNKKFKKTLEFKVKWLGQGPEYNSWEPYSALRDSEQLHAYLIENHMRTLIPQKFK